MRGRLPKHEVGGGNVFADVGLPDAELHLLKAEIVSRIDDILKERRLTQAAAAPPGDQPAGRLQDAARPFRGFSPERLLVFLAALGQDVTIRRAPTGTGEGGVDQDRSVGARVPMHSSDRVTRSKPSRNAAAVSRVARRELPRSDGRDRDVGTFPERPEHGRARGDWVAVGHLLARAWGVEPAGCSAATD